MCSMAYGLIGLELAGEQALGIASEAGVAAVDEILIRVHRGRLQIEAAGKNRLDGAIEGGGMRESALTGRFESGGAVGRPKAQNALCTAQALEDAIAQEVFNEGRATGTHAGGLGHAPLS
jgi:hypothetical protein